MNTICLICVFAIALLMRLKKNIEKRTRYFPLFSVVSHGSKPATLHMRFANCPVGKGAIFQIYNELQMTLIELQKLRYPRVRFVSHLCREGGTRDLLNFLSSHGMACEQAITLPTPWIHSLLNKVVMRFRKKCSLKVSPLSLDITIKLISD